MFPRRATIEEAEWILKLIRRVFSEHDGRIDPPSSMHRMSVQDVEKQMMHGEIWVIERIACIFLTPQNDALYLGKLTVAPEARGQGHARRLVDLAARRAIDTGKSRLRLKTRVELVENHAMFRALGFEQVGTTCHPGFTRPTSLTFEKRVGKG